MSLYESKRTFQRRKSFHVLPFSTVSSRHQRWPRENKLWQLSLQQISLMALVIQNSVLVLVMRQSRIPIYSSTTTTPQNDLPDMNTTTKVMYLASTAVFLAEIMKLLYCTWMLYWTKKEQSQPLTANRMISFSGIMWMMIPSGLYALQNNLLYVALSHLDAATFQVTYQLKILSTAIFSIVLLGRQLNQYQWLALVLLMIGVTMVQLSTTERHDGSSKVETSWIGLTAVLASCVSSGFAGCYFERMLKSFSNAGTTLWERNIQLGIGGLLFSFVGMILYDRERIWQDGFFQGYDAMTWCVITLQALAGLIVSMVMKYADNILKTFATSLSIVLSSMISVYLFDFQPSGLFMLGTLFVLMSTYLYGIPLTSQSLSSSSLPFKPD